MNCKRETRHNGKKNGVLQTGYLCSCAKMCSDHISLSDRQKLLNEFNDIRNDYVNRAMYLANLITIREAKNPKIDAIKRRLRLISYVVKLETYTVNVCREAFCQIFSLSPNSIKNYATKVQTGYFSRKKKKLEPLENVNDSANCSNKTIIDPISSEVSVSKQFILDKLSSADLRFSLERGKPNFKLLARSCTPGKFVSKLMEREYREMFGSKSWLEAIEAVKYQNKKVLHEAYAKYQQGKRIKKGRKKVNVNSTVDSTSGPGTSASSIASDFIAISSVSEYASEIDASTCSRPKRAAKCVRGGEKIVSNGKKRSQQKHSGRKFINPYKTPLSSQTNKLLAKKVLTLPSASKIIVKSKQEECEYAKKLLKKEALAAQKKEQELLQKKIKLKQKNEEKLQRVRRCREEMDLEKQEQVAQAEKEKELKRKQLFEEQRAKKQEELYKRKQLVAIKMAEHEERRRLENEARQAKLRELELEQQRQQQAKVELQLLEEKRARERLEEKRKLQEQEKLLKLNMQNRQLMGQKNKPTPHDYKARGEDDFGLEDEHSELNSDDESPPPPKRPFPSWVTGMKAAGEVLKYLTFEQMALFVPAAKTPDIREMFNITPTSIFRRNSSAIWNTPGFTP